MSIPRIAPRPPPVLVGRSYNVLQGQRDAPGVAQGPGSAPAQLSLCLLLSLQLHQRQRGSGRG